MNTPTAKIESVWCSALNHISALAENHMLAVAFKWQDKYPNHSIGYLDAMGTAFWKVDGHIIYAEDHDENWSPATQAKGRILQPLFEAHKWYMDMCDFCRDQFPGVEFTLESIAKD